MIEQTSLQAYLQVELSGKAGTQRKQLYKLYLLNYPQVLSDFEVESLLGWKCNIVTARRNKLIKQKLVCLTPAKHFNFQTRKECNTYTVTT